LEERNKLFRIDKAKLGEELMLAKNLLKTVVVALLMSTAFGASAAEKELKAGTSMAATHPSALVLKRFSELLEEKSGGKLGITVYTDAQLGPDGQMQQQVQAGTQDISTANAAGLASQVKEMAVVEFPFLYRNNEDFYKVLDGEMGKELSAKLYEKGWVALGFSHNGFRNATNSKHPIAKWEDFEGLKIRVIPNAMYVDMFTALKANPTPMPVSEVYAALETGAVDAQEAPLAQIAAMKINEVQKYLSLTRHSVNSEVIIMSRKTWDAMSKEDQALVQAAATEAVQWKREQFPQMETGLVQQLQDEGMEVNEVAEPELARMAEQMKPVIAKNAETAGADFTKRYLAALETIRAGN
jgi:tripartite ATP-independent transporter DctP family solute receptor